MFVKGQSGNPAGRPKGSRHKLTESFLKDIVEAWELHGAKALEMLAANDQATFVKVAASLMPKQVEAEVEHTITTWRWLTPQETELSNIALVPTSDSSTTDGNDGLSSWPTDGLVKQ